MVEDTQEWEETLDPEKQSTGDTKEGYYIGREDSEEENLPLHGRNQWPNPNELPKWQGTMNEYMEKIRSLGLRLTRLMSKCLGMNENFFDSYFSKPMLFLRLLHYSATKSSPADGIFGAGAHSDYGMWTFLRTDSVPGLQIQHGDVWIDAPQIQGAFIVNMGDMLEYWTGGLFRSAVHRVVNFEGKERYSIPFFYEPNFDSYIEPLPSPYVQRHIASQDRVYPPTRSGEYLIGKYNQTHRDVSKEIQKKGTHFVEKDEK